MDKYKDMMKWLAKVYVNALNIIPVSYTHLDVYKRQVIGLIIAYPL